MKSSPSETEPKISPHRLRAMVAVAGNPNAGKTTLFNALTGSHQKVGNYPGVTVERVSGLLRLASRTVDCVDVPGLYSLTPVSEDEKVAADAIAGTLEGESAPDLIVCVIDATNLERNLYLFSQLAETGQPLLVALTMIDRLEGKALTVDYAKLSNLLGVDVVGIVGHRGEGLNDLKEAIERNLDHPRRTMFELGLPGPLASAIAGLRERLARLGADATTAEVYEALEGWTGALSSLLENSPEVAAAFEEVRAQIGDPSIGREPIDVATRYQWAGMVQRAALSPSGVTPTAYSWTDRLDRIFTHRVFGLGIFVALMYLVFQSIYTFAQPLMNLIEAGFSGVANFVSPHLSGVPVLQSLVVDGLIKGVGGMLVFLPQIMILFGFIALLEGTGYLARAAFLMDRLLGWCGLNGRAFIPLLSSFACAIPGIMAARVMPDPKSRLATILVAPLMSCSARLPVYLLLIGAFIQPRYGAAWAGFSLFAMHLLGLVVAIPIVAILNRKVLHGKRLPFLLELPPYQWPKLRDVWMAMYFRARVFVKTAGTIIVFMSILIWAAGYFPQIPAAEEARMRQAYAVSHPQASAADAEHYIQESQLSGSALGRFGRLIEPIFVPAGFDWRITTSILAAFPARETVVPSLGIIFALGGDVDESNNDLQTALQKATWPDGRPLFTVWTAVGLMVFFALCAQCMATLATVRRETNSWRWAVFMFVYMTLLAYVAAVIVHRLGQYFG